MEGVNTLQYTIRKGDWLAKVDLKDAYFSVALNLSIRNIFCFKWGGEDFSICINAIWPRARPQSFNNAFFRQQGFPLVVYLDNILIIGHSREEKREVL